MEKGKAIPGKENGISKGRKEHITFGEALGV